MQSSRIVMRDETMRSTRLSGKPLGREPERIEVPFDGARGGSAPATWAQTEMLDALSRAQGEAHHYLVTIDVPIPASVSVDRVVSALRQIIERHEVLRTTFWFSEREQPIQKVRKEGHFWLRIDQGEGRDGSLATVFPQDGSPFAAIRDIALRVEPDGERSLALRVSQAAVGCFGQALIRRDLEEALHADEVQLEPATQPLDRAQFENSVEGRALADSSLAHWAAELRRSPQTMLPLGEGTGEEPRFWVGELSSPSGLVALRLITRRSRALPSATVLAAFAAILCERQRLEACTLLTISGNRHLPDVLQYAAQLAQAVPLTLECRGDLDNLMKKAAAMSLRACFVGQCPKREVAPLAEAIGDERGTTLDWNSVIFNFTGDAGAAAAIDGVSESELDARRRETTFKWTGKFAVDSYKLAVDVYVSPTDLWLRSRVDTRFVSPNDAEGLLRGIEAVLVATAFRGLSVAEAAEIAALTSLPRLEEELVIDNSLVSLPSCRKSLRETVDPLTANVFLDDDGENRLLVGYVAQRDAPLSPEMVHRACLEAGRWSTTSIAPHHYRFVESEPDDLDSHDEWRAQRVLHSGSGRQSVK